jgi:hypothetical protein
MGVPAVTSAWTVYAVEGTIGRSPTFTVPHWAEDWKTGEAVNAPVASTYFGRQPNPAALTLSATEGSPAGGVTDSQREPAAATDMLQPAWSHASVDSLQLSEVHGTPSLQLTAVPG